MATRAQAAHYRGGQDRIVALAHRDLRALFARLDTGDLVAARQAVEAFVPVLVDSYGPQSAALAAEYYDELRTAAPVRSRYRALPGSYETTTRAAASASWAAQPLFGESVATAAALARAEGVVQRLTQLWGRETLIDNAAADPSRPRFARVPGGSDPCDFCIMLASRGAVYHSVETAGEFKEFHDRDHCQPAPSWTDGDLPYDPQAAMDRYLAAEARRSNDEAAQSGGFDALTLEQIEHHIAVTEALPESDWRTRQLARLRQRAAELRRR